jgi:hypothetical protein
MFSYMNIKAFYILFIFAFVSPLVYSQQDTIERCPQAGENFYFDAGHLMKTELQADSTHFGFFVDGNAIGFRFSRWFDCPDIFDEEYSDNFDWSIEPNIDSFFYSFSHNQQPPDNFYYSRFRVPRGSAYLLVSMNGYVKGIRQGNKWLVNADVEIVSKRNSSSIFQKRKLVFTKEFEKVKTKKKYKNLAF